MNGDATWSTLPWTIVLSAVVAFFAWRSWRAGDRWTAVARTGWALVPWALWLVGLMRVLVRVADAVGDWATGLVFRPGTYVGIVVAVVAALLVLVGTWRRPARTEGGAVEAPRRERAVTADRAAKPARGRRQEPAVDEDADEIEAILRKHGIQ